MSSDDVVQPGDPLAVPGRGRELLGRLRKEGFLAILGGSVLLTVLLLAVVVPLIVDVDPNAQALTDRLLPPGSVGSEGQAHLLGTDSLGRDVAMRVVVGARFSLLISFSAVTGAALIGTVTGLVAGFRGGRTDDVLMRIVDLQLSFPIVLLALALVALLGPSLGNVILVFVLTSWPVFARTIRASTLTLKERAFVEAARGIGTGRWRIMFRQILPNALGPLIVVGTFELAKILIYESSLGFLGLGVQPPTATWGNMMSEGRSYLDTAYWITLFPGLILVLTAAAANWLGDGANQLVDPRLRSR
jgi:peptide/nickel transport system permease protein